MAAGECRRWLWALRAVACVLHAICRSLDLSTLMASTTWEDTAVDMATHGIPRSVFHIQTEWKAYKAAFYQERASRVDHCDPSNATLDSYW